MRYADDGTFELFGRGSQCINSGGEKIYVEEVESVLRSHSTVADAVVVGTPHERWGSVVTAVVQAQGEALERQEADSPTAITE